MTKQNVIWLMIDGLRNYPSSEKMLDSTEENSKFLLEAYSIALPMGKPPILDQLASEGIEFTNAVTSALSTAMAISAQFMGVPAYFISRNFNDFVYDQTNYDTISDVLVKQGYEVYTISFAIDVRYKYKGLIKQLEPTLKPNGLKENSIWDNDAIELIMDRLVERGVREPYFLFVHINARREIDLNNRIEKILEKIRNLKGHENSIFITTSDHGMPDPVRRADYYHWMERNNIPINKHDLVGTDDNVMIPLIIQYPNCVPRQIDTHVGAIDIVPTILDLLGYDFLHQYEEGIRGVSLVSLIKGKEIESYEKRIIRSDARYITQRESLVSLRGKRFKYIVTKNLPDREAEVLYDLLIDPLEKTNLAESEENAHKVILEEMREEYLEQEKKAIEFHQKYLIRKFKRDFPVISRRTADSIESVCIFGSGNEAYLEIVINLCLSCFSNADLVLLTDMESTRKHFDRTGARVKILSLSNLMDKQSVLRATEGNFYDLTLVPLNDRLGKGESKVISIAKVISSKHFLLVDSNMDMSKSITTIWLRIFRTKFRRRLSAYRRKPIRILEDISKVITREVKY